MDIIDERLDVIREWVEKYNKREFNTVRTLTYAMDHADCIRRMEYLLRQLDLADTVIQAVRNADTVSPDIAVALEWYDRRKSR